jgi:hypothetical protein
MQAIAERVVLHEVVLRSIRQLQSFERKVGQNAPLLPLENQTSTQCATLVRFIEIEGYDEEEDTDRRMLQWMNLVVVVLLACPLLRSLKLHDLPVTQACTASLLRNSPNHLTSITLCVDSENARSSGVFDYLGRLRRLEELHIRVTPFNAALISDAWDDCHALVMPYVKMMSWILEEMDYPASEAVLRYISRCRIDRTAAVHLDMVQSFPPQSTLLVPFFEAHRLKALTLACNGEFSVGLAPQLARIERVSVPLAVPPIELLAADTLPSHLTMCLTSDDSDVYHARFWAFLKNLPIRHGAPMTLRIVRLRRWRWTYEQRRTSKPHVLHADVQFGWSDGKHDDNAAFIGKLVGEAIRLYDEGVIIVDSQGRDIAGLVGKGRRRG